MTKMDANVAWVAAVMKEDHWMGSQMTEEKTGIPKTIMQRILHHNLKKWKICTRFVPQALTAKQHNKRVADTCDMLEMVKNDPEFSDSIITGDESWCFVYDLETPVPKCILWRGKFSQSGETLFPKIENQDNAFPFFSTISAMSIKNLFLLLKRWMLNSIWKCWLTCVNESHVWGPIYEKIKVFFLLYDNAPVHTTIIMELFLAKKSVTDLSKPLPPFQKYESPSNYFAILKFKIELKKNR